MAKFSKADRQRIVDSYLQQSGRNQFLPGEFVDWLAENPSHEAYDWFHGKSDAEAAREYRTALARRFVNDLRIVAKVSAPPETASVVSIAPREFPAFVSPVAGRKSGGGYVSVDPTDAEHLAELRRQAVVSLNNWLRRYSGAMAESGVDVSAIEEIAAQIEGGVESAA